MATKYSVEVSTGDYAQPFISGARKTSLQNFRVFLKKVMGGDNTAATTFTVRNTAVPASGTITLASATAGTSVEVNGVEFLAISGTPVVANGEFDISGTDTADGTSLAAAINGSTDPAIAGVVTATASNGVVTVTSTQAGYTSNGVTIKTNGVKSNGTITVASVAANDTITLNGQTLTAKQQRATGTVTCSTAVAGDTVTVNGVVFTAVAGAATLGAPTFSIDTGDNQTATSLTAQINALTDGNVSGIITATASTNVVTLRAVTAGTAGNSLTLATSNNSRLAKSGAALTGGIAVANNEFEAIGTNTQVATDMVRAINASSTALVNGHVRATSNAAVVTLYARYNNVYGNAITLASSNGGRLAVSGARLTGGTTASDVGAQATGTVTVTGGSGNYTVTINGVATGNVAFNATDNQTASDIADAINKLTSALVNGHINASAATNVVTITAIRGGVPGNAITLACTGTGAVASVARLAGGAVPTTVVPSAARLTSGSESQFTLSY